MRDLVKLVREKDKREIDMLKENLKKVQSDGLYPEYFNFPLTMQFELTRNCNLMCKHCYNASGIKNFEDEMTPEKWIEFSKKLLVMEEYFNAYYLEENLYYLEINYLK